MHCCISSATTFSSPVPKLPFNGQGVCDNITLSLGQDINHFQIKRLDGILVKVRHAAFLTSVNLVIALFLYPLSSLNLLQRLNGILTHTPNFILLRPAFLAPVRPCNLCCVATIYSIHSKRRTLDIAPLDLAVQREL